MRLCFAHDFRMIQDTKGNVFSIGGFSYDVWKRYLEHFSNITVVARQGNIMGDSNESSHLSICSGPLVDFVPIPNLSSLKGKLFNNRLAKQRIRNILEKSDALIARLPSEIGKLAINLARQMDIPYLIELVGCPFDAYRFYGNLKGKIYAPISMYQTKRLVRDSKYTIYVTKYYLQNRYPTKGKQIDISNVNITKTKDKIINNKIEKLKSITNRKLIIGMIGSLESRYKGFDKAIKYLSVLKPYLNNFEIRILGGGDKKKLEEVVNKCNMQSLVFFDGLRSSGDEVLKWLDNIDLYIHPSLTEGLPRSLIEALSRGCLAIGSDRGGIPELLPSRYTFDPISIDEFKKCINFVLKDSMEKQVINNIKKANEYSDEILSNKRNYFLKDFLKFINEFN